MNSPYMADPTGIVTNSAWCDTNPGNAGVGSPEGVACGSPGTVYVNTTNGDLWVKLTGTGTTTGWTLQIPGGGATSSFTSGNGPPVGDPGVSTAGYFNRDTGEISWWNEDLGIWQ